jgi:hypothetical protein
MLILEPRKGLFAHFQNSLLASAYNPPISPVSFGHLIVLSDRRISIVFSGNVGTYGQDF